MLSGATVCVLMFALPWPVSEAQQDNARIECPKHEILNYVGSVRSNKHENRRWMFRCKKSPGATKACKWSDYSGALDQPLQYTCPGQKVLNGMRVFNGNGDQNRRFMMQCCTVAQRSAENCRYTGFVNDGNGDITFHVPGGQVIKGVYSTYYSPRDYRSWMFFVCDLVNLA